MPQGMKNLLDDRKRFSDVCWALRKYKPVRTYNNTCTLPKNLDTLSEEVLRLVTEDVLNENKEEDRQILTSKVKSTLEEICCSYSQPLIRSLSIAFSKLLKKFYSGVFVNEEAVAKIKAVIGNSPVIFVPSHRSYCDFIIMAFVCFSLEIEIPCVAAAIDFSSMKIIGNLLRDCKAFFIRRNFNTDPLYKLIFQRYLQYLIIQGNSPVEFFIEGTRSRTGKALPPKFGLLKTIIDSFVDNDVPDIIILPIGISYDRIVEDMLFSYELLGVPKPPESTKGFFKAIATMDEKYGNIFINFGEPLYLKSYLMQHKTISWPTDSNEILEKLGFQIIKEQLKLQKILCINILCLVLHDEYMKKGNVSVALSAASSKIQALASFLQAFGAVVHLSDNISNNIHETLSIHKSFFELKSDNTIQLKRLEGHNMDAYEKKLKGAKLKNEILDDSVSILRLQQYINHVLCVLASPAFVVLLTPLFLSYDQLLDKYRFLRNIFVSEFIFIKGEDEKEFKIALTNLHEFHVIKTDCNGLIVKTENWLYFSLASLLIPYLICYHCTCKILQGSGGNLSLDNIIKSSQLLIQDQIKNDKLHHHASLSLDAIYQAVNSMIRLQVVKKENRNGCDIYKIIDSNLLQTIIDEIGIVLSKYLLLWHESNSFQLISKSKL